MDVPRDVGFDAGPATLPQLVSPAANARMLGRRIRFEARFPVGALRPILVILSRECVAEQSRHLMSGGVFELMVGPGVVCWRVLYQRPGGDEVVSAPRRLWALSRGTSTIPARMAGLFPDYDRTGPADFLVGYSNGQASGVRLRPTGEAMATALLQLPGAQITQGWHVGDLNGDGYGDAVLRVQQGGTLSLAAAYGSPNGLVNNLTTLHTVVAASEPGFGSLVGPLADIDFDGRPDLVSVVYGMTPRYYIYRSTDDYRLPTPTVISALDAPVTLAAVGPSMRPGDAASLFLRGARGVQALLGTAPSIEVDGSADHNRARQVLLAVGGDLNHDGVPELTVYNSTEQTLHSYQYNSTTGAFEGVDRVEIGGELQVAATSLVAPGPYMADNTDYLALLSTQGTHAQLGGFQRITTDPSPAAPFAAALGPVGNDSQGALGTVTTFSGRQTLTTMTVFTPGTFALTRYAGLDASTLVWMAP